MPSGPTFDALDLVEPLRKAIRDSGYEVPTPIQSQAIPPLLEGRDILGCAQTGTGKTAAFALPILQRLFSTPRKGTAPRALILAPTRELVVQIADSFKTYGRHTRLTGTTVYGGVSQYHQVKALRRGLDIIVATPGRLLDLMEQGAVDLSSIEVFVLDEADRMLDMGFIAPIRRIAGAVPTERQTLLFSATMPKEIVHLAESLLRDPVRVAVTPVASAVPLITQSVYLVSRSGKLPLLQRLLQDEAVTRSLVFVRTKHGADKLCDKLNDAGIRAGAIHGNKAQNARQRALDAFRSGRMPVLVATDVAARGIDVDDVSHVFNVDLPFEPEAYVHRIGRTGRAGALGTAIAFCDAEERGMLRAIEKLIGTPIERAEGSDASLERGAAPPPMQRGKGGGGGSRGGRNGSGKRGGHSGASKHSGNSGHAGHSGNGHSDQRGRSSHAGAPRSGAPRSDRADRAGAPHGRSSRKEAPGAGAGARASGPGAGRLQHPAAGVRNASSWSRPLTRRGR